jgi:hypothetical protein
MKLEGTTLHAIQSLRIRRSSSNRNVFTAVLYFSQVHLKNWWRRKRATARNVRRVVPHI